MMPYADHNLRVSVEENHSISFYSMDAAFERLSPRDTNHGHGRGPTGWTTAVGAARARAVVSANASVDPEGEGSGGCCVGKHDVLCGKEKICYTHPGNKLYRALIAGYFETYQGAARRDLKTQITACIVSEVHRRGGRFLKPSGAPSRPSTEAAACCADMGRWELEDMDKVHDKVSHALRTAKERGASRKGREPGEEDGDGFPSNKRARRRGPRAAAAAPAAAAARGPSFREAGSSRRGSASSQLSMLDGEDIDSLEPLDPDTFSVFDGMFGALN